MTDADLLTKVFLPAFEEITPEARDKVLQWVVNNWSRLQGNAALRDQLSRTRFVATGWSLT